MSRQGGDMSRQSKVTLPGPLPTPGPSPRGDDSPAWNITQCRGTGTGHMATFGSGLRGGARLGWQEGARPGEAAMVPDESVEANGPIEVRVRGDDLANWWMFADRGDAGRRLARCLDHLRGEDIVVVGLPRGGVVVAVEVARELRAPLDVIVVRKLGVPFQPELAMGAIGEGGARVVDAEVMRGAEVTRDELAKVEAREREELQRRAQRFREGREQLSLAGRVVVIVDDGVATGSTARAACQVARAQGAARIVLAVPVAPVGWQRRFTGVADELICIATPDPFWGISGFYADFSQIRDEEVLACLAEVGPTARDGSSTATPPGLCPPAIDDELQVPVGEVELAGWLTVPASTRGVVVLAHGSGSSSRSMRSQLVARLLNRASLATLLFDLLTPPEGADRAKLFDIELLATRLGGATEWLRHQSRFADLPVGWLGANTGAAAVLQAAAEPDADTAAVVCRGGRPDLVGRRLCMVRAPTLLIAGSLDPVGLDLNRKALARLRCRSRLAVIPGATHLFVERGALETATAVARAWFLDNLARAA